MTWKEERDGSAHRSPCGRTPGLDGYRNDETSTRGVDDDERRVVRRDLRGHDHFAQDGVHVLGKGVRDEGGYDGGFSDASYTSRGKEGATVPDDENSNVLSHFGRSNESVAQTEHYMEQVIHTITRFTPPDTPPRHRVRRCTSGAYEIRTSGPGC